MIVVSDTSAITNLIQIDHLWLLREVYQNIIIPQAVYDELVSDTKNKLIIESLSWIKIKEVKENDITRNLKEVLDPGESEAITLALELDADFIIIDEKKGRKIAEDYGLRKIGLVGILVESKRKGLIKEVRNLLEQLIDKANFFVSEKLYKDVLFQLNEL
jgi:predicted nucleic acid-binding protein